MRATTKLLVLAYGAATVARGQNIPIRQVGPPEAVARDSMQVAYTTIRPLSDGRIVIANRRRVVVYDSALTTFSVAVDSNALTPGRSTIAMGILAARSDTTLVVDLAASSFLVVDKGGKVVRVIAAPKAGDMSNIASTLGARGAYVDPQGRLIYRGYYRTPPAPPRPDGLSRSTASDSQPIVRADFDARAVDTLIAVRLSLGGQSSSSIGANGRMTMRSVRQPLPILDAWTMLPDGTIAIVRASDYHMDWLAPDGTRSSSPKMPFDWRRITEAEKVHIVDSLKQQQAKFDSANAARTAAIANTLVMITEFVPPSELPDYYPPIRDANLRSDPEGNVWILPTTSVSAQGGLLYDIVNRKGVIFERVQLPAQCALAGLGERGVVYLICENARLEKRRIIRSNQ